MDIQKLLHSAEIDAEKISAIVRLVVFFTLLAVILSADTGGWPSTSIEVVMAFYGIGMIVGLVLAWRGVFYPAIPYLFVTFDVILVSAQILMLAGLMGMGSSFTLALPAAGLIFVILVHASIRYRPWLVAYTAGLFLIVLNLGGAIVAPSRTMAPGMNMMGQASMGAGVAHQVLPVTIIMLVAFILFVANHRARALLLHSITQSNRAAKLARYFSPNLANSLTEDDERLLAGQRVPAAVVFVDIRGFTALGERLSPEELTAFLSEFRNRLTQPIFARGGTVDKFIGDAIMAVFGAPLQRADDADRALICALEILEATQAWSRERQQAGQPAVAVGLGIHYGEVFAGALGGEQLLEYTVIGDTVNVAERLEGLSRQVGSPLVVSDAVMQAAVTARHKANWRRLPPQDLKGHRRAVEVFCLEIEEMRGMKSR